MKYNELKSHLNEAINGGGFARVYLLTGGDDYLLEDSVRMFKSVLSPDFVDLNFSRVTDVGEAISTLYTFPAFDFCRICVLDAESATPESVAPLKDYLSAPAEEAVLVAILGDAGKTLKGKNVVEVSCAPLDEDETRQLVRSLFADAPAVPIDPAAVDELILRTQSSLLRIVGEVQKLKAYSPSGIRKADVQMMVASDIEYQTYILSEAVSTRDAAKALSVMDVILKSGVPERVLLGAIYERYRRLLHVSLNKDRSNEELARIFGYRKPGAVFFLRKNADSYSQVRLKSIVDYLHSLQYAILQGARTEAGALHEAMLEILAI